MAKYKVYDFLGGLTIPISQGYGENVDYYKKVSGGSLQNGHEGVDFKTINGTKLYVPFENAIVVRAGSNVKGWENYGTFIVLWDPVQCCALWFCHLESYNAQVNDKLKLGDPFALTNNTGNTSGPHVHVNFCETDKDGLRLNQNNGSLGFLNLMDKTLVEIVPMPGREKPIQPPVEAQPSAPPATKTITLSLAIPEEDNEADYMGIKKEDFSNMRGKCDAYDAMAVAGYHTLDDIDKMRSQLIQQKQDQQQEYEKQLAAKDDTIKGLLAEVKSAKDEAASVLGNYQKAMQADSATADTAIKASDKLTTLERDVRTIAGALNTKPNTLSILDKLDSFLTKYDYFKRQFQKSQPLPQPVQNAVKMGESWGKILLKALGVSGRG